ncbi:MAG: VOC family protein [Proteobacteria bacterium]|nr:VOC family protein [Pseudomonadota bacterium]
MTQDDQRPPVAVGHVSIDVTDIGEATNAFVNLGMRHIHQTDTFAVLELRGGTHLVVRKIDDAVEDGRAAPFDLMVDDIDAARAAYQSKGFAASEISRGRIHDSFTVTGPDAYAIKITSSHAGSRPV